MSPTSASNRQVTLLRKLNRKKYRQKEQLFLLEGARAVKQVLESGGISIKALFFDEDRQYYLQEEWREAAQHVDSFTLTSDLFAEVSDTDTPQGVLAMCQMPEQISFDELSKQEGIIVAFNEIQDPGNLGTIIRTATWFEAVGLLSGKGTVDLFHPKVVRSTAGATGTIPYMHVLLSEILPEFEERGWEVILLDAERGARNLRTLSIPSKTILVVGNEANGIHKELKIPERQKAFIPTPSGEPKIDSLNAAVSMSIALYAFSARNQ